MGHGYFDNYGYYFGYFDRTGYFFNNIFFTYNNRYSYYDRLHRRGFFKPNRPHFRKYKYTRGNNWNKKHKYRRPKRIYGHYYDRKPKSYKNRGQIIKKNRQMEYKKRNFDNRKYDHRKNYKKNRYEAKKNRFEAKKNRFNSNRNKKREYAPEYRKSR